MATTETFGRPALLDVQERSNNKANLLVAKALLRAAPLLQRMPVITSAGLSLPYTRRNVTRVGQVRQINRDYAVKFAGESSDHTASYRRRARDGAKKRHAPPLGAGPL